MVFPRMPRRPPAVRAQEGAAAALDRSALPARPVPGDPILPHDSSTETTDLEALTDEFPGLLTPFSTFLEETGWGNASATYEDLSMMI